MKTIIKVSITAFILIISLSVSAQEVKKECVQGDCKNGYGVFNFKYGDVYMGQWKDGKQHGQGTWVNRDKSKSVGNWNENFQDGLFEVYDSQGNFSHRELWVKGKGLLNIGCEGDCENGLGTYVWEDGNWYEGYWKEGKQEGKGNLYLISGDKYFGDWKNGLMHGNGSYQWKAGNFYIGEYKDGKMNGVGKKYNSESVLVQKGTWIDNVYQINETGCISGNCENSTGTYLWEDGNKYEGEWKDGKMHGTGTFYLENGEIYHQGKWKNHNKVE